MNEIIKLYYFFRLTWQRIKALQIFAEKVYLPHCKVDGMLFIIKRLEIVRLYSVRNVVHPPHDHVEVEETL